MNIFKKCLAIICALSVNFMSLNSFANDDQPVDFSQAELEQMLAPIALYPDSLLTHILIASTYPLEIIQAQRWLTNHPNSDVDDIADGVENKDWDASVKALMPFPRVIKRLNDDLDWTQKIGDAFLQNEQQVLASIQILRQKADSAGSLDQMDNMDVSRDETNIIIKSVEPEIVYVPYYDSRYVYGDWYWHNYPPVYWNISHNRRHYYRGYNSPFYWDVGVAISFNYFFNAFHWNDHRVVVVNHYAPHHRRSYSYGYQINHHKTKAWRHNPSHRRGVAYRNDSIKKRYHSNRVSYSVSKNTHNRTSISRSLQTKVASSRGNQTAHYANKQQRLTKQMKENRHRATNVQTVQHKTINNHKNNLKTRSTHVVKNQQREQKQINTSKQRNLQREISKSRSVYKEKTVVKQSVNRNSHARSNNQSNSGGRSSPKEKSVSRTHQKRSNR